MFQTLLRTRLALIRGFLTPTLFLLAVAGLFSGDQPLLAAALTPGNIVIYRVGTGSGALGNTGNAVFLDEYTPAGALVQSIALPTAASGANKRLVASGTATSEGLLTRSADGQFLILTGYDAAIPTTGLAGTTAAAVPRVVGRVDASGNIDTSTALTDYASGNNPRAAASTNGSEFWFTGAAGGVRRATLGSTTSTSVSTTVANLRAVHIFDGQLYVSTSSGSAVRIGTVGSGIPAASGQTIASLPGFPTAGSPYQFFLADLSAAVPGVDTLYVADDTPAPLSKFSLVSGSWVASGTVGASDTYRGLAGSVSGSTVTLYATRKGGSGSTGGGELVQIIDTGGYNGAFSGSPTVLATAAANTAFRGVALAPGGDVPPATAPAISTQPASQSINSGSTGDPDCRCDRHRAAHVSVVRGHQPRHQRADWRRDRTSYTTPPLTAAASYWVRVTNSAGPADSATAVISINASGPACSAPHTPVSAVQGSGEVSPFAGSSVTVQGVVVGDYEGAVARAARFLPAGSRRRDGDPATSEGIFVFEPSNANNVGLGQVVQVTGAVSEFRDRPRSPPRSSRAAARRRPSRRST